MENDLISRSALKKAIQSDMDKVEQLTVSDKRWIKYLNDIIDNAPTVEPEIYINAADYDVLHEGYKQGKKDFERPQGKWEKEELQISIDYSQTVYYCSECHSEKWLKTFNYCPNCGAQMEGEKE